MLAIGQALRKLLERRQDYDKSTGVEPVCYVEVIGHYIAYVAASNMLQVALMHLEDIADLERRPPATIHRRLPAMAWHIFSNAYYLDQLQDAAQNAVTERNLPRRRDACRRRRKSITGGDRTGSRSRMPTTGRPPHGSPARCTSGDRDRLPDR